MTLNQKQPQGVEWHLIPVAVRVGGPEPSHHINNSSLGGRESSQQTCFFIQSPAGSGDNGHNYGAFLGCLEAATSWRWESWPFFTQSPWPCRQSAVGEGTCIFRTMVLLRSHTQSIVRVATLFDVVRLANAWYQ